MYEVIVIGFSTSLRLAISQIPKVGRLTPPSEQFPIGMGRPNLEGIVPGQRSMIPGGCITTRQHLRQEGGPRTAVAVPWRSRVCHYAAVGVRNQPLRIVVVVGLWVMFALWTITRFTGTVVEQMPNATNCAKYPNCASSTSVEVARQFSWSWWHFVLSVVGAALLVAASVMILRTPRSLDDF